MAPSGSGAYMFDLAAISWVIYGGGVPSEAFVSSRLSSRAMAAVLAREGPNRSVPVLRGNNLNGSSKQEWRLCRKLTNGAAGRKMGLKMDRAMRMSNCFTSQQLPASLAPPHGLLGDIRQLIMFAWRAERQIVALGCLKRVLVCSWDAAALRLVLFRRYDDVQTVKAESGKLSDFLRRDTFKVMRCIYSSALFLKRGTTGCMRRAIPDKLVVA